MNDDLIEMDNYAEYAINMIYRARGKHVEPPSEDGVTDLHARILRGDDMTNFFSNKENDIFFMEMYGGFYLLLTALGSRDFEIIFNKVCEVNKECSVEYIIHNIITRFNFCSVSADNFDFIAKKFSDDNMKNFIATLHKINRIWKGHFHHFISHLVDNYEKTLPDNIFHQLMNSAIHFLPVDSLFQVVRKKRFDYSKIKFDRIYTADTERIKFIFATFPLIKTLPMCDEDLLTASFYELESREQIALVDSYKNNPYKVREKCRTELELPHSADIFALCIFMCDDFLQMP